MISLHQLSCYQNPRLVNLTHHTIRLYQSDDSYIEIPPTGKIARVGAAEEIVGYVGETPIIYKEFGSVVNLPDPVDNVVYITSTLTAETVKRPDVVSPDRTPHSAVRDDSGKMIGVRILRSYTPSSRHINAFESSQCKEMEATLTCCL
ncbi:hypothetical protein [Methanocalculus sp. MC3]